MSRIINYLFELFKNFKSLLILLIIFSPGLLQLTFNVNQALEIWLHLPVAIISNTKAMLKDDYQERLFEMRWGNYILHRNGILPKIMYSKLLMVEKYVFDWVEFATPRFYFLTGDGSKFSPSSVEPVPALLAPFWFIGLLHLIKKRSYYPFILLILFTGLGFFSGIKNLAVLWPVIILYIYISVLGLHVYKNKWWFKYVAALLFVYSLYCFDMVLYAR